MNSFKNKKDKKSKKKHDKKSKKDKKKRRRSSSSSESSTSSSSSSSSSSSDEKSKKRKKHKKDHKRKRLRVEKVGESSHCQNQDSNDDFSIPIHLMDTKRGAPETKEEYEKRQNIIRRVVDEETGRTRLVKGDGEIIEEIVTRDRHMQINKQATKTDAQNFEKKIIGKAMKK
jgi:hypothetical protein